MNNKTEYKSNHNIVYSCKVKHQRDVNTAIK